MIKTFLILISLTSVAYGQKAAELENYVKLLSTTPRVGIQYADAANYIFNKCLDFGIKVDLQKVGSDNNVVAWIEGNNDKVLIIGAHLDTVPGSPGADDNASGSAAVLGLARRFSQLPNPDTTLVFVWFCKEETGLVGSRFYAKNPLIEGDLIFMLNFDMIGRMKPGTRVETLANSGGGASDHASFRREGVKVSWIFTGIHKDYHKSSDTADKINYQGMEKICQYAYELIRKKVKILSPNLYRWN